MIQLIVFGTHRLDPVGIIGKAPGSDGRPIQDCNHAVDRHPRAHLGPAKGLDQRFGQCQAGGFDDNVIGRFGQGEDLFDRRQKVVGDRAADAAIGQLEDVFIRAVGIAAAFEQFTVHREIAEFIDHEGKFLAVGLFDQVTDHRGLAGTKKAGDNGCWYFSGDSHALSASSAGFKNTHRPLQFTERSPARGLTIRPTSGLLAHGSKPHPGLPAVLTTVAKSRQAHRIQLRGQPGLGCGRAMSSPLPVPGSSARPT